MKGCGAYVPFNFDPKRKEDSPAYDAHSSLVERNRCDSLGINWCNDSFG